jgi:hypothetical protein
VNTNTVHDLLQIPKKSYVYLVSFQQSNHLRPHHDFWGTLYMECANTSAFVGSEVSTAVTMKNAVFLGVMPCGSCKKGRFGGSYRPHHQDDKNRRATNSVSSN